MTQYEQYETTRQAEPMSGWTIGGVVFAATVMVIIGIFQVLQGLAAIIDEEFFVVVNDYAFDVDVTVWGWIHLIVGILVAASGFALFAGREWAAAVAIVLAVFAAIANFFFIPYYPVWSLLMIALALWVIWSLTRPGAVEQV